MRPGKMGVFKILCHGLRFSNYHPSERKQESVPRMGLKSCSSEELAFAGADL